MASQNLPNTALRRTHASSEGHIAQIAASQNLSRETASPVGQDPVNGEAPAAGEACTPALGLRAQAAQAGPGVGAPLTLDEHKTLRERIQKGDITPAALVAEWERFKGLKLSLREELNGLSKSKVIDRMAGHFKIAKDTKATKVEIINGILKRLEGVYQVQPSFQWSPLEETHEAALDRVIRATTAADIAEHAARVVQQREDSIAERAKVKKAVENPETLEEFQLREQYKVPDLSIEQKRRYEELKADAQRAASGAAAAPKAAVVPAVPLGDVAMELHTSKHTKTGEPLSVVTLNQRVDRDLYNTLNERAKKLGGWYSSYSGNGAIPGFTFKNEESAKAFMATDERPVVQPAQPAMAPEQVVAEKKAKVSSKLRDMAEKMIEKANEEIGRSRTTNTYRQSNQAASSIEAAEGSKALAQTMLNLADAIEDGRAKHLGGLKNRAQIEELDKILGWAIRNRQRTQGYTYSEELAERGRPANQEDVDHAAFPYPSFYEDHLTSSFAALENTPGLARATAKLRKIMASARDGQNVVFDTPERIDLLTDIVTKLERQSNPENKWLKERLKDELVQMNRLKSADIETTEQLRAALREYLVYKTMKKGEDPIKAAERSLIGSKIPGYFPTPQVLAQVVVEKAEIQPGMRVLEPNGGKGSLIDAMKEAHGQDLDVETLEPVSSLRTILQAKGHNLVGYDLMEHAPGEVYDRVVMNPPFENFQDIDHTQKAFEFLKPGGRLVAITSAGPFFRADKKALAFREWLEEMGATFEPNPEGSFTESGTGVNTYTVVIDKPKQMRSMAS